MKKLRLQADKWPTLRACVMLGVHQRTALPVPASFPVPALRERKPEPVGAVLG